MVFEVLVPVEQGNLELYILRIVEHISYIFTLNQARDRQKKRGGTKGIRIDAEGDASLEDLTNPNPETQINGSVPSPSAENAKSSSTKVWNLHLSFVESEILICISLYSEVL